ncbi:MAG: YraN family protein [Oscillatoriales cyanobacterium C42_A2020_001]|nr:YraN family protein [Leptolyngbyaceae cyanobacterium C42_A2020_001]
MPHPTKSPNSDPGLLGEALVARWLQRQGWQVLERRWHCRWGELDLVIGQLDSESADLVAIAFVEVKTRRGNNWDEDGKLAITAQKQAKLWKTAQLFLMEHPTCEQLPCRFDVALVNCEKLAGAVDLANVDGEMTAIAAGYRLTLSDYIIDAFTQI